MKYQIQSVTDANQTVRTTIASYDGLLTDSEQTTWFNGVIQDLIDAATPLAAGQSAYIVPENHPWYKHTDAGTSIGSAATSPVPMRALKAVAADQQTGAPLAFSTVAAVELTLAAAERSAKLDPQ